MHKIELGMAMMWFSFVFGLFLLHYILTNTLEKLKETRCRLNKPQCQFLQLMQQQGAVIYYFPRMGFQVTTSSLVHPPQHFKMITVIVFSYPFITVMDYEFSSPRTQDCDFEFTLLMQSSARQPSGHCVLKINLNHSGYKCDMCTTFGNRCTG